MTWTRQRLFTVSAVIFAGQLAAIFGLHTRAPFLASPATPGVRYMAPPISVETNSAPLDQLTDPLIFAGAHPHGFSASAWMRPAGIHYAPTSAVPAAKFLAFARAPLDFTASNTLTSAAAPLPLVQLALPTNSPRSTFEIEGSLAGRPLAKIPEVPIQYATDVLTNTVIQLGVQSDGVPFSARILSGSGLRGTDLVGLQMAQNLRFAPIPSSNNHLQWGHVVFRWHTAAPLATNSPAPVSLP